MAPSTIRTDWGYGGDHRGAPIAWRRLYPPQLARAISIEPTAAGNRLVNLERKGYVYRISRARRQDDLFIGPVGDSIQS